MEVPVIWVFVVIFAAVLTRATFGFGDALVSMPFLIIFIGTEKAAPLVAMISFTIALAILVTQWKDIAMGSATRLVMFGLVGIYMGTHFLEMNEDRWLKIILGIVVILFGLYSLWKPKLLHLKTDRACAPFGIVAGFLTMVYLAPGPPLIVYGSMRQWGPKEFRATLQSYFLPSTIIVLAIHAVKGRVTWEVTWFYLWSLPIVAVSLLIGNRLNRKFETVKFLRTVHWFLIAIGCLVLFEAIRH